MRLIAIALLAVVAACAARQTVTAATAPPPVEAEQRACDEPREEPKAELKEEPGEPVAEVVAPSTPPPRTVAAPKVAAPPAKAPEKAAVARDLAPAPAPARTLAPTLDVADLKARLRETKAFGVLTKLALQNQVDDLLQQFRALHQDGQGARVGTLRAPFDALVGKVLALLQEGDASLARAIAGSREAIWEILSDPEKFDAAT